MMNESPSRSEKRRRNPSGNWNMVFRKREL
jgi:hypothetical protein